MPIDTAVILRQIDEVIAEADRVGGARIGHTNAGALNTQVRVTALEREAATAVTLVDAAIHRLAPPGSSYSADARNLRAPNQGPDWPLYHPLLGILKALRADYAAGRLLGLRELIHADLFSDFLESAQHLLDEGYKDPAAVIAGSALEAHLRKLADKHSVTTAGADGSPRKSSVIAADLAKAPAGPLSKLDAKNVTAWLDLRNNAAHGHYTKYVDTQVALLIQGVRDFITRVPA